MAAFWEIAAHPVEHVFSLYFDCFEGWSWVLIASVPDLCILFTSVACFFGVRVSVTFHFMCVYISFSLMSVTEWSPFRK